MAGMDHSRFALRRVSRAALLVQVYALGAVTLGTLTLGALTLGIGGCGDDDSAADSDSGSASTRGPQSGSGSSSGNNGGSSIPNPLTDPTDGPPAGNPNGMADIPAEARPEDVSSPDVVVGSGTADSCTSEAFVSAVAQGGVITFDCGDDPVTITLDETARVFNNTGPQIVIDGGGLVTLSGAGARRILYMNTCDESLVFTTPNCDNQDHPQLTVQNLTFVDGNASGESPDGGGAIYASGGRFKIVNSRFFNNTCDDVGPDVGGGAVRVLQQFEGRPVFVVNSTFGGEDALGNVCSNGGGLSSIGVSFTVINSTFSHNRAIGNGANPAQPGTPGGGSGGAIYNDGNLFTLTISGTTITDNTANEGGGAIFFVSNDRSGSLILEDSTLARNISSGFETDGFPGIFVLASGDPQVRGSTTIDP